MLPYSDSAGGGLADDRLDRPPDVDVIVVGAGFAGLYAILHLVECGFTVRCFESASDVGGVWYWNRYPGARCDVESVDYSYSFSPELEQDYEWTERYAAQPDIQAYLSHAAERFDLRSRIQFDSPVTSSRFDEERRLWRVTIADGASASARFLVLATGPLSVPLVPSLPGIDSFAGAVYHTSRWPSEPVDFTGRRVGVIGTGSSGIQSIPVIAEQCEHLYVFQRTANFSIPAQNRPMTPEALADIKANYRARRALTLLTKGGSPYQYRTDSPVALAEDERRQAFEAAWERGGTHFLKSFGDLVTNEESNRLAAEFVAEKIRSIVDDPAIAELLIPSDHPLGSKRICADTNYYQAFNRQNVTLVDLRRTPIAEVTPSGIRTEGGEYGLDDLVLATGFDAMTGSFQAVYPRGAGGLSLRDAWRGGPRTYLGVAVAGFPNLFLLSGPGSPSVLANMVRTAEQQVDWLAGLLRHVVDQGATLVEADVAAQDAWVRHVNDAAEGTIHLRANNWYLGANVPGKPRVFMPYAGGLDVYRRECDEIAADGYRGFAVVD
ncbi:MAG: NAD(P)-binding protein [Propionibacteriales bacterium]|nr:NAD(P)-binding protein [Propionibacteriales bacterium]